MAASNEKCWLRPEAHQLAGHDGGITKACFKRAVRQASVVFSSV